MIGNGDIINFWIDSYLDEPLALKFKIHDIYHNTLTSKVSDFSNNNNLAIHDKIRTIFPSLQSLVFKIYIAIMDIKEMFVWTDSDNGIHSLKQAYNFVDKPNICSFWSTFPWNNNIPHSIHCLGGSFIIGFLLVKI